MGKLIKTWQDITARSFWNCIMERGIFIRQVAQRLILTFSATPTPTSGSWLNYNQIRMQFMIAKHLITVDYNPFWLTTRFPIVPTNLNNYQKPFKLLCTKMLHVISSTFPEPTRSSIEPRYIMQCKYQFDRITVPRRFPSNAFSIIDNGNKKSFAHFVFDSILDLFSSVLNNARMCKLG